MAGRPPRKTRVFRGVGAQPRVLAQPEGIRESVGPTLRGSFLGFGVGLTPGAGATVASLMSYNVEKSVSRTPEKFGKGAMPGLVGPESANNAASSGAMVPLLTLGIPGGGATAVLLGGFLMWGLQPGPLLMEQNPEFAWDLIASMYLGNVMLLAVNIFCIPAFASIARVPFKLLGPIIVLLCALGTFAVNKSLLDVQIMLACGVLGFFMRRYGLSPAALVIALVLGPLAEETLRQTLLISGGHLNVFVERGTSVGILFFIAFLLMLPLIKNPIAKAGKAALRLVSVRRRGESDGSDVQEDPAQKGNDREPVASAKLASESWALNAATEPARPPHERRRSATHCRGGHCGRHCRDLAAPARRSTTRRDGRCGGGQHCDIVAFAIAPAGRWIVYVCMGWLLGLSVTTDALKELRRAFVPIVVTVVAFLVFGLVAAWLLWRFTSIDSLTALLATAPGGIAQMGAFSVSAGANVPIVLTVHVLRITSVIVVMSVGLKLMEDADDRTSTACRSSCGGFEPCAGRSVRDHDVGRRGRRRREGRTARG